MLRLALVLSVLALLGCSGEGRVRLQPGQVIAWECVHKMQQSARRAGNVTSDTSQEFKYRLALRNQGEDGGNLKLEGSSADDKGQPKGKTYAWAVGRDGRLRDSSGMTFNTIGYSFPPNKIESSADQHWRRRWPTLLDLAPVGDFAKGGKREIEVLLMPAKATITLAWTVGAGDEDAWELTATGEVTEWNDVVKKTKMLKGTVSGAKARVSKKDGLLLDASLNVEVELKTAAGGSDTRSLRLTLQRMK